jgi:hypothetical protein
MWQTFNVGTTPTRPTNDYSIHLQSNIALFVDAQWQTLVNALRARWLALRQPGLSVDDQHWHVVMAGIRTQVMALDPPTDPACSATYGHLSARL